MGHARPAVNSSDGFEEMPIRDCLCLFAHPAHGLDSCKHRPDFPALRHQAIGTGVMAPLSCAWASTFSRAALRFLPQKFIASKLTGRSMPDPRRGHIAFAEGVDMEEFSR